MSAQRDGLWKRCDCSVESWRKCEHSWHLKRRHDGQRFAIGLDVYAKRRGLDRPRTRGEAETLADRITKEIQTGTYQEKPTPPRGPMSNGGDSAVGLTFDAAWPKFTGSVLGEIDSLKDEEGRYRKLAAVVLPEAGRFGALPLAIVTDDHIEAVYAAATKGKADHTRRKYRRNLKRLFKWAVTKKHLVASPITDETVLRVGKGVMRTRRVRPKEEADLIEAAGEGRSDAAQRLAAIIVAALDLAMRSGELLALQWRDILWDEYRVFVRAVEKGARKNRRSRRVPLTPRVVEWLRKLQALAPVGEWSPTDYVFGDAIGGRVTKVRKAWVTAVLRAHNVQPAWTGSALTPDVNRRFQSLDLHFHDLRHEGALRWLEKGYGLNVIAKLLGHSNMDSLKVYLGVEEEDALAEAERINATFQPQPGQPASKRPQKRAARHLRVVQKQEVSEV